MKIGTFIGIVAGVVGAGAVGYYVWQRRKGGNDIQIVNEQAAIQQATAHPYENKLVRVNRGPVYLVLNGQQRYISKLPLINGRGWNEVIEVGSDVAPKGIDLNLSTLKGFLIR